MPKNLLTTNVLHKFLKMPGPRNFLVNWTCPELEIKQSVSSGNQFRAKSLFFTGTDKYSWPCLIFFLFLWISDMLQYSIKLVPLPTLYSGGEWLCETVFTRNNTKIAILPLCLRRITKKSIIVSQSWSQRLFALYLFPVVELFGSGFHWKDPENT